MSDLISESVLIKVLNDYVRIAYDCGGIDDENVIEYQQTHDDKAAYIIQGFNEVYELLRDVPTAYNVDKVVEQVADEFLCDGCSSATKCFELDIKHECGSYRALEKIIKKGGVEPAAPDPELKPEPNWKQALLRTFLGRN